MPTTCPAPTSGRRWIPLTILALCVTLLGLASDRAGEADEKKKRAPRTYALLIGCTEYPEFKKIVSPARYRASVRLLGCLNDVELLQKTLIERLGASKNDIVALAGWPADATKRPTGANVRAALQALAKRTYAPGDRVIVHYSGHGVQQPDDNQDETDGLDEAWLVADARKDRKTVFAGTLRDEEIGKYLRTIRDRGATVWCIMDCCHSATGTRGAPDEPTMTRGLDAAVLDLELTPAASRGLADGHDDTAMVDVSEGANGLVVFYAAQSFQTVPEVRVPKHGSNRKAYGLLTTAIVRALANAGDQLTFAELYEQVVAGYRDLGQHHIVQPYAEGDVTQRVFGGTRALSVPLFVRRVGPPPLELSAGALHGLAVGTELDVYSAGHLGDAKHKLGRVVVTKLRPETASVKTVAGSSNAWVKGSVSRWPAQIAKFVIGDTSLPLAIVDEHEKPVAQAALHETAREILSDKVMSLRFPLVASANLAKWILVVGQDGKPIALSPAVRGRAAPRFDVRTSLEETLLTIYRGENLLKLASRDPRMGRMPSNLRLKVGRRAKAGGALNVRSGQRVAPGSVLDFGLIKDRARSRLDLDTVDVYVFWIDPHYGISKLYPPEGSGPRLTKDDVAELKSPIRVGYEDGELISDESQGLERLVVFAAPRRKDAPHLNLDFLEQPPIQVLQTRGAGDEPDDPAASLLNDLAFGSVKTRGRVRPVDRGATGLYMRVFTFESRWNAIRIPPAKNDQPAVKVETTASRSLPQGPPDAWSLGADVRLARAGPQAAWCLLVAREAGAAHVLVDLDGEVPAEQRTPGGLKALVGAKGFDAEMAIRIESKPRRTVVWYDVDDDGTFDHVLIDADMNHRAEERYRRTPTGWVHEKGLDLALLSTGHLDWIRDAEARIRALERISTLAGE